jgi:hypothetical protein
MTFHPMQHRPLSEELACVLGDPAAGELTFNQLLRETEGRGLYLVMILLGLPFVAWFSPPGLSTILGTMVVILTVRLALGKPPRLPARLGDRPMPPGLRKVLQGGGVRFLRFLEKGVRPRRTVWLTWRWAQIGNALLVALMGFLLALPLPSPPFYGTNALPSYAIILIAASMMEEDGLLIWLGYAAALATIVYFGFWTDLVVHHLPKWLHSFKTFVESFL